MTGSLIIGLINDWFPHEFIEGLPGYEAAQAFLGRTHPRSAFLGSHASLRAEGFITDPLY